MKCRDRARTGQAFVIAALAMTVLCGMLALAMDVGLTTARYQTLRSAAEAAADAGAYTVYGKQTGANASASDGTVWQTMVGALANAGLTVMNTTGMSSTAAPADPCAAGYAINQVAISATYLDAQNTVLTNGSGTPIPVGGGTLPTAAWGVKVIGLQACQPAAFGAVIGHPRYPISVGASAGQPLQGPTATPTADPTSTPTNTPVPPTPTSVPPIAFVSRATASSSSPVTSLTILKPANAVQGNVLIAQLTIGNGGVTITPPAGWTPIREDANILVKQGLYYHIVGNSESGPYTWSWTQSTWPYGDGDAAGSIGAYSGADTSNPINASSGAASSSSSTTITAPGLTTTVDNAVVVGLFGTWFQQSITLPSGETQRWTAQSTDSNWWLGVTLDAGDEVQAVAGPTGTRIARAGTAAENVGQLVALRPASQPATATPTATPSATAMPSTTPTLVPTATPPPPVIQ